MNDFRVYWWGTHWHLWGWGVQRMPLRTQGWRISVGPLELVLWGARRR